MAIDRRHFLQLSALGVAALLADSGCATDAGAVGHPELLSMLGAERVRELGQHYRATNPGENNGDALRDAISRARSEARARSREGNMSRYLTFLGKGSIDDTVRADFAAGRTVLIDGWVLSVTEARQAALFSLTAG